ncbi:ATP-binding protein [Microbacterium sp. LRZ72]|uniref:ATP-binding protein n=1 Tax=Microbacterium sp. LRZ72 TaxID=2942481 RepID=UPI0029B99B7A|nr:ATP-binding protein [Microbacterium sp. LRZ72]MDX2376998.1 ATP-binding protein [Microbacterium sp. LRZ72]
MATEAEVGAQVDRAWGHIPQGRFAAAWQGTFTRSRIERITAIAAGVASAVLGLQSLLLALTNDGGLQPGWREPILVGTFGLLIVMCVACMFERTARIVTGIFAVAYIVVLLLWPLATAGAVVPAVPEPWPWYLINVATIAAVIAFPPPLQLAWTIGTPLLYGAVRLVEGDFAPDYWVSLVFEVPYSLILGGLLLTLVTIFRRMASGVDRERAHTVAAYAQAAEAQAAQEERVAVSALMHDSVLAALIAASRADGPRARSLAVSMAREALEGLAGVDTRGGSIEAHPQDYAGIARGIQAYLADLGVRLRVEVSDEDGREIPGPVAAAMIRAATQAAANAVQHADGKGLAASVRRPEGAPPDRGALEVEVRDRGPGFDLAAVPDDRLGISASILARVAAVDGTAVIDSDRSGTVVTLRWEERE